MAATVTIVDYGVGNLYSVRRAVEVCGGSVVVSSDPEEIERAERLILPGVGAFADGIRGLHERGLAEPIGRYARAGRPLLGICLGMQMLATASEEFGRHSGMDLIPGEVVAIPRRSVHDRPIKVPFIGWTPLIIRNAEACADSCLDGLPPSAAVYLVHSYHFVPTDDRHRLAAYSFGGHEIGAAVRRDNITGFQFHPEKSGSVGLDIMARFVARG